MNRRNWFKVLSALCLAPALPELARIGLAEGATRQSDQHDFGDASRIDALVEAETVSVCPAYVMPFDGLNRWEYWKNGYVLYEPALTAFVITLAIVLDDGPKH